MNYKTIKTYLRHYGSIHGLRASVIRSTFARVVAAYDEYDEQAVIQAMLVLGQKDLDNLICTYCPAPATCWDHLDPAAEFGSHQIGNLVPSCTECNWAKGGKTKWQNFLEQKKEQDQTQQRIELLTKYTNSFPPNRQRLVTNEEWGKLKALQDQIFDLMKKADEVVAQAVARHKGQSGM